MTKGELKERLVEIPAEIAGALDLLVHSRESYLRANQLRELKEDALILSRVVDGRSERIREAQIREALKNEPTNEDLRLQSKLDEARVRVLEAELKCLIAIAALLEK